MRNILKRNCKEFEALLLVSVLRTFAKTSVLWECSFFWKGQLPHWSRLYLQRAERGSAVPVMDRGWWQILLFHKSQHSSWCLLSESIRRKCLCCRAVGGCCGCCSATGSRAQAAPALWMGRQPQVLHWAQRRLLAQPASRETWGMAAGGQSWVICNIIIRKHTFFLRENQ